MTRSDYKWFERYINAVEDYAAICDEAGVNGDSAPFEVAAALRAPGADVEALRALSGAATPGPWFVQGTLFHGPDQGGIDIGALLGETFEDIANDGTAADAALIVEAVNFVRAALTSPKPAEEPE